jgi:hypothetical protein
MLPSPTRMFLNKGVGVHRHALTAFEFALRPTPSCRLAGSPSGRCLPKNAHSLPEDAVD